MIFSDSFFFDLWIFRSLDLWIFVKKDHNSKTMFSVSRVSKKGNLWPTENRLIPTESFTKVVSIDNIHGDGAVEIFRAGTIHRSFGPSQTWYDNGSVIVGWRKGGKVHRVSGPATIHFWANGFLFCISWSLEGKYHRITGPAVIRYRINGSLESEEWIFNDERYRSSGPPFTCYRKDGSILRE